MSTRRIAMLEGTKLVRAKAALFAGPGAEVRVDDAAGVIRNAAVMTCGTAMGHGFAIDAETLQQVASLINGQPDGVRVRLKHPETDPQTGAPKDGTATMVGRLRNARLVGQQVRGDVYLGDYAAAVPGYGDARTYLLKLAANDPTAIGLSAVIDYEPVPLPDASGRVLPTARVFDVLAVDFAEIPAANPNGLLSAKQPSPGASPARIVPLSKGVPHMELLQLLQSLGLDPAASTPEQIDAFVATLSPEQRAQVDAAGYKPATAAMSADAASDIKPDDQAAMGAKPAAKLSAKPQISPAIETRRVSALRQLGSTYGVGDGFVAQHVALGSDVETFVAAARAELAKRYAPTGSAVSVGDDRNIASLAGGISDGIRLRCGLRIEKPHDRSREFRGLSLAETARAYLNAIGVNTTGMSRTDVAKLVFNRGRLASLARAQLAHSTSDFSNILQDTVGKTLRTAYEELASTWEIWARRATAPDFKTISRTQLSEAPDLDRVFEGGEYTNGKFSDAKETYTLTKYGKIISITWESLINDDLDAFSRIPTAMGQAARRKEDDVAYFVLLNNAAMADTGNLFNSTAVTTAGGHANLSGASAAPTVALLNTAVSAMSLQKGPELKAPLNLRPQYFLVPPALSGTAWELVNSTSYVASNVNSNVKNRYGPGGQVNLTVIEEPRLQSGVTLNGTSAGGSSTAWYLAASTSQIDTVEVCFLADEPAPVVEEEDGFRVDGRQYKIRHTIAAKAIDFRGLYKYGT